MVENLYTEEVLVVYSLRDSIIIILTLSSISVSWGLIKAEKAKESRSAQAVEKFQILAENLAFKRVQQERSRLRDHPSTERSNQPMFDRELY